MTVLPIDEFMARTMGGRANQMDVSIYFDLPFECVCGKTHNFNSDIRILRELGGMRLVLGCPDKEAVTCIKIKGVFKYKLQSLFGAISDSEV